MNKREYPPTAEDSPRRIYSTTLARIDKHLQARPRAFKKSKRKEVKGDFNKFLISLLDAYEFLQTTKLFYYYDGVIYDEPETPRGKAILDSVKNKKSVVSPTIMIEIGEDEL